MVHCWCFPHVPTLGRHITRRWNWSSTRKRSRDMKRLRSSWLAPQQPLGRKPTPLAGKEPTPEPQVGDLPNKCGVYLLYFFYLFLFGLGVGVGWIPLMRMCCSRTAVLRTAHRSFQSATLLHLLHLLWKPVGSKHIAMNFSCDMFLSSCLAPCACSVLPCHFFPLNKQRDHLSQIGCTRAFMKGQASENRVKVG